MNASIVNADGTPAGPLTAGQRRLWLQAFRSIGLELVFDEELASAVEASGASGEIATSKHSGEMGGRVPEVSTARTSGKK